MPMNPRLLRPRQTGFDPKSISGLFAWWDFSDLTTVTSTGSNITAVADKSGNSRTASQAVGNNQPILVASARNGLSVAEFDGVNDALDATAGSFQFTSLTVFATAIANGAGGGNIGRILERASSGMSLRRDNTNVAMTFAPPWLSATGNGVQRSAANTFPLATWLLLGMRYTGGAVTETDVQPRINRAGSTAGLTGTRDSFATTQSETINIGNRSLADGYDRGWAGRIGEILVFTASLSDSQVAAVESYLFKKWGF